MIELGWSLPRREEYFRQAEKQANEYHRLQFQGHYQKLKLLMVPIELPKYRLSNGRTVSLQDEWITDNPDEPSDLFRLDPESERAQQVQHDLLRSLIRGAGLKGYFKDPAKKQTEPLVLDSYGYVVNGNRRLCCWREFFNDDREKYSHFSHVRVTILPTADDKEIDRLEAELQIVENIKDEYTWDTLANMIDQRRTTYGYSNSELAGLYDKREAEIVQLLDMREYAISYLDSRGSPHRWSVVSGHEYAFREIVRGRRRLKTVTEKRIFETICFALIDKPGEAGSRLYTIIKDAAPLTATIFERLRNEMLQEGTVQISDDDMIEDLEDDDFFKDFDFPLPKHARAVVRLAHRPETGDTVRSVVRDVIEETKATRKEEDTVEYVRKKLQRANAEIHNAVNGINESSSKSGVSDQLKSINDGLGKIRRWLDGDT